jgi:DNA repair exonuclease SbcCD ATPase subunit
MDPTTNIRQTRDALLSRVDEQLAHTYEQIKSADEQLDRMKARLSREDGESAPSLSRHPRNSAWLRGFVGLLLAAYIVAAAFVSQSSYGDAVTRRAPLLVSAFTLPLEKLTLLAQPTPSSVHLAAAEATAPDQGAPPDITSKATPNPPEPAKLLQAMARQLADLEREIEQLKASQQQMASDNANAIEQLKTSQEQAARDIAVLVAKISEKELRPKPPAPQQQLTAGAHKPVPTPAAPQSSVHPRAPVQLPSEPR